MEFYTLLTVNFDSIGCLLRGLRGSELRSGEANQSSITQQPTWLLQLHANSRR